MTTTRLTVLLVIGLASNRFAAAQSATQEAPTTQAWMQFLASEIRELRRELLEDRIERQETRIRTLARELQKVNIEREQAEVQRQAARQQMAELERQLADPAITVEERQELAAVQADVISHGPSNVASSQRDEPELSEGLRKEQLRLDWLRGLARSLAPPSTGSQQ
jgi:septal ring factor EnvC (AmiA/AmiB activator)